MIEPEQGFTVGHGEGRFPCTRASHIKRRKEIWEALHPVETGGKTFPTSLSDGRKAGPQHEQGFAAETAAVSGETKRSINQHIARAEALGDDINEVVGTSLDKGVELDALARGFDNPTLVVCCSRKGWGGITPICQIQPSQKTGVILV